MTQSSTEPKIDENEIKKEPIDSYFDVSTSQLPVSVIENQYLNSSAKNNSSNSVQLSETKVKGDKPSWFPTRSGRSIVWNHINWIEESQRASCNYCTAEFQIKGGTSAVLRHLKSNHPQMIDFDPETAQPVKRKKKKTEDVVIISDDTRAYMDNLLKQFLPENELDDSIPSTSNGTSESSAKARAESEIDEVLRSLQQEKKEKDVEETDNCDKDIRKILGILEEKPSVIEDIGVSSNGVQESEKDKQLDSESSQLLLPLSSNNSSSLQKNSTLKSDLNNQNRKRRAEDKNFENGKEKFGKFSMSLLSSIRRTPSQSNINNLPNVATGNLNNSPLMHSLLSTNSSGKNLNIVKQNPQSMNNLDLESKILYNKSLSASIAREEAMTRYYDMKTKLIQMELERMEKMERKNGSKINGNNN